MKNIIILDEITANKISAGEVVERPASVVKELVENALDAGSTTIRIDLEDGGTKNIIITDNGTGISANDVPLAFQRHATSKITDADDLDSIRTLGFRGEALPSIAAVSKVSLSTRIVNDIAGNYIEIHGGKQIEIKEIGCPIGTQITVSELFFNTPARKKHLKSLNIEAGHISDIVGRLAMASSEVSFHLTNNKRTIIQTPGTGNTIDAFASIYGVETARELLELNYQDELISLQGLLAKPTISRSNRNHQSFYINNRYIKSRIITEAIEDGYHTLLNIGRHPLVLLKININPELVDVNVHPTKMEVKFSHIDRISTTISRVVRETLLGETLIPEVSFAEKKKPAIEKAKFIQQKIDTRRQTQFKETNIEPYQTNPIAIENHPFKDAKVDDFPKYIDKVLDVEAARLPDMDPIGQIDATYIVTQGESGMYLIDQHAAHERILYEKFMKRNREIVSQELLVPITLELNHIEAQILVNNIIILTDLGFHIEHFGGNTFLVRAVPQLLPGIDEKIFFLDLLDSLSNGKGKLSPNEIRESILITMACKAAIKANHRLTIVEMIELINQLQRTDNPYTCPHGRPTIIHMSNYELEKKFKRVM